MNTGMSAYGPLRHLVRRNEMSASEGRAEVAQPSQIGRS
jgi:hypothetical protein